MNCYTSLTSADFEYLKRVSHLDFNVIAESYVRLYSLLNVDSPIIYEGFDFFIKDNEKDIKFSLALTASGLGYFAEEDSGLIQHAINEFHNYLFNEFNELKECEFTYEHDFGTTTIGYRDGQIFEIHNED